MRDWLDSVEIADLGMLILSLGFSILLLSLSFLIVRYGMSLSCPGF